MRRAVLETSIPVREAAHRGMLRARMTMIGLGWSGPPKTGDIESGELVRSIANKNTIGVFRGVSPKGRTLHIDWRRS